MKPAPPVMKIRLPSSAIAASVSLRPRGSDAWSLARGHVGTRTRSSSTALAHGATPPVSPRLAQRRARSLDGGMSRAALLAELVSSTEFARVRLLDDCVAWAAAQRARRRTAAQPERAARHRRAFDRDPVVPFRATAASPACSTSATRSPSPPTSQGWWRSARRADRRRSRAAEVPGSQRVADLRELPFDDGSFDVAIASRRSSTSAATTRVRPRDRARRRRARRARSASCAACSTRTDGCS